MRSLHKVHADFRPDLVNLHSFNLAAPSLLSVDHARPAPNTLLRCHWQLHKTVDVSESCVNIRNCLNIGNDRLILKQGNPLGSVPLSYRVRLHPDRIHGERSS